MIKVYIDRMLEDEVQNLGMLSAVNGKKFYRCFTIEKPWKNNEQNVSCIPEGEYKVVKEWSNRFQKDLWEVKGVDGRSEIKFHSANYSRQLQGCIGLGRYIGWVDGDKNLDVTNSALTLEEFHAFLGNAKEFKLIIE